MAEGGCEPALNTARATLLVVAAPLPRTSAWLSDYGEPLVRFCTVPILFVPEMKLTLLVGVNLVQSAFTHRCPMMTLLARAGVKESPVVS